MHSKAPPYDPIGESDEDVKKSANIVQSEIDTQFESEIRQKSANTATAAATTTKQPSHQRKRGELEKVR